MATQRKIPHVLVSEGDGRDFRYRPTLGVPFDLAQPVWATEKVDGSTMQVLNGEPFKRYDNFKAGDPRKHGASEAERYRLEACSRDKPHERYYLDAFDAHHEALTAASQGRWVYFEAMGGKIGARYKGLAPTVRVFDMRSVDGEWYPWEDIALADRPGLPLVGYASRRFGSVPRMLELLADAESMDDVTGEHALPQHDLEGWVLRQGSLVAKIRKGDLGRVRS